MEKEFQINLPLISGGNSANYQWYKSTKKVGRINNLRLGESILLGCDTGNGQIIPKLHTNTFKLIGEVIESKIKPSLPFRETCQDAFGNIPVFRDLGMHQRAIIALGKQDTSISGLSCDRDLEILGASSDHLFLNSKNSYLKVGIPVNL